jgi:hypothetical protein
VNETVSILAVAPFWFYQPRAVSGVWGDSGKTGIPPQSGGL